MNHPRSKYSEDIFFHRKAVQFDFKKYDLLYTIQFNPATSKTLHAQMIYRRSHSEEGLERGIERVNTIMWCPIHLVLDKY